MLHYENVGGAEGEIKVLVYTLFGDLVNAGTKFIEELLPFKLALYTSKAWLEISGGEGGV